MIAKISKGKGFGGLLAYLSQKSGAEYICGNVAENPHDAAVEMGTLKQYSRCRNPVWHCSLSLSPQDRNLSNAEFAELAERFISKMGLLANQYCVWRHSDREHSHVHIVANRISLDEKHTIWNAWRDIKRAREAKAELESEYQLTVTPYNPQFAQPEVSRGQQEAARRTGTIPQKQYIAESIATAAQTGNVEEFIKSLSTKGIEAVPNISQSGRMNGFSFQFGKRHYKGSQLRCAWKELSARLGYTPEKDNKFLFALLPEDKRPAATKAAEPKEPRRQHCIYSMPEWEKMGGVKGSDHKRAYRMIDSGYSLKDVAQELRLHNPSMSEKQLRRILYSSGKHWIENNRDKLSWAYNSRRHYLRFSSDPAIMLLQVLGLLVVAAGKAILRDIEERHTARKIDSLSQELRDMTDYVEKKAMRRLHTLERQERQREPERENLLLQHALEKGLERSR